MFIDLAYMNGDQILRYESDYVPSVNETISMMRPKKTWEVIGVDNLIKKRAIGIEKNCLDVITITVREI